MPPGGTLTTLFIVVEVQGPVIVTETLYAPDNKYM